MAKVDGKLVVQSMACTETEDVVQTGGPMMSVKQRDFGEVSEDEGVHVVHLYQRGTPVLMHL